MVKQLAASLTLILSLALLTGNVQADIGPTYKPWLDVNDDGTINVQDLMLVATEWGASEDTPPMPDIDVVSDVGWWEPDYGWFFITGEIRNNESVVVNETVVHAKFYKDDILVAKHDGYTPLNYIPPGEKTCYYIVLTSIPPEGWDYYELKAEGEYGGGRLPELTLDPVEVEFTFGDFYYYSGTLTNTEENAVGGPTIILTVYDETGQAIGCDKEYAGDVLGSGESIEVSGGATGRVANSWSVRWQYSGSVIQ